ncbi:unnamed protein product [Mesocestoides corti]|uniref:Uncharacterized protein n=1 Tax=Mesocestoides corti TaxID=53468 RepID=A0A0R3UAI2_MESCO|nr:unnamed protein product [Mesocestoides corti]
MDASQGGLGSLSPSQRTQLVDQMKAEVAIASARELMDHLQSVRDKILSSTSSIVHLRHRL